MDSLTLKKLDFDKVRQIVARFCSCSLGKDLAARLSPSRNPQTVVQWLARTSEMIAAIRDVALPPFGGITDIRAAMTRACPGGGANCEDFVTIASALEGAANLKTYLNSLGEQSELLHELAGQISTFEGEVKAIRSIIGPDATVMDEASTRLAKTRREIAQLTQHIHDVIHGYLRDDEVAKLLQNVTVTLHGDRYVLPVKAENRGRLPGVVHRASGSGATVFVEPNASVELNNRLSDLREDERREIQRLLGQLALRVSGRADQVASTMRIVAQIDLLSAKAQYAYQFDMTCPQISEHDGLEFHQARHPLLIDQAWRQAKAGVAENQRHSVVPIDVRLGIDFDLLVITGSNTGGKTVTLKTVAVLVLMAQSGLHIPVQRGAKMPVFDNVFIDVGDEQSLEQSLSTFGAHITRIKHILANADRRSLVLLDELGSGTDPDEGGAIGEAILDELREIGCPGMVTTHLSVLKAYALNHDRVDNASVEFDTKTLRPTYHLRIGTPGESHAITVAKRIGLPERVTGAARVHLSKRSRHFLDAIRATGAVRQSAEAARADAQNAQLAADTRQEDYQNKLQELQKAQEDFELWLASLPEMKPGDEVHVPSLGKAGRLVRLELHKQIAVVDADNVQVEVPLRELLPDLGQKEVRRQIVDLRKEMAQQAALNAAATSEAKRMQQEYKADLAQLQQRGKQFDAWLHAIGRVKIGDEVPIARRPGKGKLLKVDLAALRATVATKDGELELRLQELFPQTGLFAPRPQDRPQKAPRKSRPFDPPRRTQGKQKQPDTKSRPMPRRKPSSHAAKAARKDILSLKPGQQVYVVPFGRRAKLIRINAEKGKAVVLSGAFEMEIPLADIDIAR